MISEAFAVLNKIYENGYDAYIIGGFVRDFMLNRKSDDIDISTNIPVDLLAKLYKIDRKNESYGSLILHYSNDVLFEVTLFRKELSYVNKRHPIIELVDSYKEDYIRRDFTINSLGFDHNSNILDYCNASYDIDNKLIRTIREPNETFSEDPVRILRAIYFRNKLKFDYETATYKALLSNVSHLKSLSITRVAMEFEKICKNNLTFFIKDLITTKAYKYLPLKEVLLFVYKNKIFIESFDDLLIINRCLRNTVYCWDIKLRKKIYIQTIAEAVLKKFPLRTIYDLDDEKLKHALKINYMFYKNDIREEVLFLKRRMPIHNSREIDFQFKDIIPYITDKKQIKVIKDEIIDKIISRELPNNRKDIINFIISRKNML